MHNPWRRFAEPEELILNLIGQRALAASGATVDQQNRHGLAVVNKRN
jgi:hypothetical protein